MSTRLSAWCRDSRDARVAIRCDENMHDERGRFLMSERARSLSLLLLTIAFLAILTCQPAGAMQMAEESFKPSFPAYGDGGVGFSGPWALGGWDATTARYRPRPRSLCYASLDTAGGSLTGDIAASINGVVRWLTRPLGADNTTVYVSVLLQPDGTHPSTFADFFGFTLNGGLGNDLFIGKPADGAFEQWVVETRGGVGQVASGVSAIAGQTTLLVLKAQFFPGNDAY